MQVTKSDIQKAVRKAKREYDKGVRYYDKKHGTYNPASYSENILQHVSDLIDYYGIEAYEPGDNNPSYPTYSYINSGDSYTLTLIYNHKTRKFIYSDIGTIIEATDPAFN